MNLSCDEGLIHLKLDFIKKIEMRICTPIFNAFDFDFACYYCWSVISCATTKFLLHWYYLTLFTSFICLFWPLGSDDPSKVDCVSNDCCLSKSRFFFLCNGRVSTIISSSSYVGSQFKPSPLKEKSKRKLLIYFFYCIKKFNYYHT